MLSTIVRAQCGRIVCARITQNFPTFSFILVNRNLGSDARPKRPVGSYLLFCQETRPHIVRNNPDLSFAEIARHLGEEWKRLSDIEKQPFNTRAKELLEEYRREKYEFESSLSETEREELQQADEKKKTAKERRKMKIEMKKLDKPKRPKNAYAIFLTEHFRKGEANAKSEVTRIAELWNNTIEGDRVPYQEEAKGLKEDYDIELEAWKERMIADGREDLFEAKEKKIQKKKKSSRGRKKSKKEAEEEEEDLDEDEEDDAF